MSKEAEKRAEERDIAFETDLLTKAKSVWCYCKKYRQTEKEMADGWDCTCDLLYEENGKEVETRFFLDHVGFMRYKKSFAKKE